MASSAGANARPNAAEASAQSREQWQTLADDQVVEGACDWGEAWSGEEDEAEDEAAAGEGGSRPPRHKVRTLCTAREYLSWQLAACSNNNKKAA